MASRLLRVRELGEEGLLSRYLPDLVRGVSKNVMVPAGDDAAVVKGSLSDKWVVTTDMMVEGVHFLPRWTDGADLGHKALAINLSDLAAMGDVKPAYGVVCLGITPETAVDYVDNFYRGLKKLANLHRFDIVGGDTVRSSKMVVSITAVGRMTGKRPPVLRSGAQVGDVLLVTGTLGDAAAGLSILTKTLSGLSSTDKEYLTGRFLRPQPRLQTAKNMVRLGRINSLMDSSDGLWKSARTIGQASGVGMEIEADLLPVSPALRRWAVAKKKDFRDVALVGGEDYELVLTASPSVARRFEQKCWARVVGRVVRARQGVTVFQNGKRRRIPPEYEHFQ
jgi:thiamine-monophosphate kinase